MGFRFENPVRTHVENLGKLLEYANSRMDGRWANSNGVHGIVLDTITAVVREELGNSVAKAFRDTYIYYGDNYQAEDIEKVLDSVIASRKPTIPNIDAQTDGAADMYHQWESEQKPLVMLRIDGEVWRIEPGHDTDENSVNARPVRVGQDDKAIAAGVTHIQTGYGGEAYHEIERVS